MPRQRIVSYHPIITTREGWIATERYGIPKFLDGSCRTEPDFGAAYPSITALCRKGKFAPTLYAGDIAVYVTVKRPYFQLAAHQRLVAMLEVVKRFERHEEAAEWYRGQGLSLPRNCMVAGNEPLPLDHTVVDERSIWPGGTVENWDEAYQAKANEFKVFLACKPLYLELHNPPIFTAATMIDIFGNVPGTQNPRWFKPEEFEHFTTLFDKWQAEQGASSSPNRTF